MLIGGMLQSVRARFGGYQTVTASRGLGRNMSKRTPVLPQYTSGNRGKNLDWTRYEKAGRGTNTNATVDLTWWDSAQWCSQHHVGKQAADHWSGRRSQEGHVRVHRLAVQTL